MNNKKIEKLISLIIFGIFSSATYGEGSMSVSFKNNSDGLLKCEKKDNADYVTFLRLRPDEKKEFQNFHMPVDLRCYISISSNSVTTFTYFPINKAGEYELLKEKVPCEKCKSGTDSKWATIVVYPDGKTFYSKW
ncbi:MAG: hypothetical protein R3F53_15775 [Gammaproteobacteria bacterium]